MQVRTPPAKVRFHVNWWEGTSAVSKVTGPWFLQDFGCPSCVRFKTPAGFFKGVTSETGAELARRQQRSTGLAPRLSLLAPNLKLNPSRQPNFDARKKVAINHC